MNKFLFNLLLIFALSLPISILAQQDSTETWNDSTDTQDTWSDSTEDNWDNEDEWTNDDWKDDWNFDIDDNNYFDFEFSGKPYLEANYGMSKSKIKSLNGSFNQLGIVDVKLGYSTLQNYEDYVIKYRNRFLFLSNLSQDLSSEDKKSSEISMKMWRFGLGSIDAYGYSFGQSAIIPYSSNSIVWSRMELENYPNSNPGVITPAALAADTSTLNLFNNTFRFGTYTEAGLKIQVIPLITLNGSFERTLVFPRHMFWKHLGSMAIEWIGVGAVEIFTKEVLESSPAAGPIVNFLLKNAVTFGLYQLRREKMNWPFKTAEPLAIDTWKVGMTFTF